MKTIFALTLGLALALPSAAAAQINNGSGSVAGQQATANVHVMSHIPGRLTDIEVEQELSRPYAYVSTGGKGGFNIINLKDPSRAFVMYSWQIESPELHQGSALGPAYLKSKGRYYFAQSYQYRTGSPDYDLGAIIFDVTGLPDTSKVKEVARIKTPEIPGGFHEEYAYKHSDGRALLFETTLDPARRRLLRVTVPDDDRPYTERTVSDLMGKEPEARYKFIMEEAYTAKDIDI